MFTKKFERRVYIAAAVLGFSGALGVAFGAYILWPSRRETGYEPAQPIPFSHKLHAGVLQINCLYCHHDAPDGPHARIPSVSVCMNCHAEVQPTNARGELKPAIETLLDHWERQEPVRWEKVYDLADFVYFDHSRHLAANLDCRECHGAVEEMERVRRVQGLKMSWCLDCHKQKPAADEPGRDTTRKTRAPIHCSACHR